MKRLSVVLLILVLVAGSVFAAMTPEFSGKFRFGYKFSFGSEVEKGDNVASWKTPAQLKLNIEFGTDVWKIAVKSFDPQAPKGKVTELGSNDKLGANLTFNIDKVADMGDHKLAVNMGWNNKMTALSVYNDVTGDEYYKFKNNGATTFEARYAYADVVKVNLTVDPIKGGQGWDEAFGATPADAKSGRSFMISAQGKIVDGVTLAAQYGYRPQVLTNTFSRYVDMVADAYGTSAPDNSSKEIYAKNGFGASVNVDIAKLASLDFMLKFSAYDNFGTGEELALEDEKGNVNVFAANVQGGVEAVNGYAEIAVETLTYKNGDDKTKNTAIDLAVGVQAGVVEDLPINVYFKFNDLGNKLYAKSFRVGAEVFYKGIVGVDLGYSKSCADTLFGEAGAFTITPKMQISF